MYFGYLKYAIGIFRYDCYVDLTARTNFSQLEYNYIANGVDNVYLLDPPPYTNSQFYVGYRSNSDVSYTQLYDTQFVFDSINNTITTNIVIPNNYEVYIGAYIIGEFTYDLNEYEIDILSEAMLIPWSQEQLMKNSLMEHLVYGGSAKTSGTQANQIKAISDVTKNQYYVKVKGMISDYSYKFNSLKNRGLGGGLI